MEKIVRRVKGKLKDLNRIIKPSQSKLVNQPTSSSRGQSPVPSSYDESTSLEPKWQTFLNDVFTTSSYPAKISLSLSPSTSESVVETPEKKLSKSMKNRQRRKKRLTYRLERLKSAKERCDCRVGDNSGLGETAVSCDSSNSDRNCDTLSTTEKHLSDISEKMEKGKSEEETEPCSSGLAGVTEGTAEKSARDSVNTVGQNDCSQNKVSSENKDKELCSDKELKSVEFKEKSDIGVRGMQESSSAKLGNLSDLGKACDRKSVSMISKGKASKKSKVCKSDTQELSVKSEVKSKLQARASPSRIDGESKNSSNITASSSAKKGPSPTLKGAKIQPGVSNSQGEPAKRDRQSEGQPGESARGKKRKFEEAQASGNSAETIPPSQYVALDCEFVGCGPKGSKSALGRCSLVDYYGHILLDIYSRPDEPITDFRTPWSGIRPRHMINAVPFEFARRQVKQILKGKVLIGHDLKNDLSVLSMEHPREDIRDTTKSPILNGMMDPNKRISSLKKMAKKLLGRNIQVGRQGHCSVEDARASLDLFKLVEKDWRVGPGNQQKRPRMLSETESFLDDAYWQS